MAKQKKRRNKGWGGKRKNGSPSQTVPLPLTQITQGKAEEQESQQSGASERHDAKKPQLAWVKWAVMGLVFSAVVVCVFELSARAHVESRGGQVTDWVIDFTEEMQQKRTFATRDDLLSQLNTRYGVRPAETRKEDADELTVARDVFRWNTLFDTFVMEIHYMRGGGLFTGGPEFEDHDVVESVIAFWASRHNSI